MKRWSVPALLAAACSSAPQAKPRAPETPAARAAPSAPPPGESAAAQATGAQAFFAFGSQQDFKDARQVIGGADQGGLGLPDRDYYLKDDERTRELRALYQDHIEKMLALAGASDAEAKKHARISLEVE